MPLEAARIRLRNDDIGAALTMNIATEALKPCNQDVV
jgi:hypothetical protein